MQSLTSSWCMSFNWPPPPPHEKGGLLCSECFWSNIHAHIATHENKLTRSNHLLCDWTYAHHLPFKTLDQWEHTHPCTHAHTHTRSCCRSQRQLFSCLWVHVYFESVCELHWDRANALFISRFYVSKMWNYIQELFTFSSLRKTIALKSFTPEIKYTLRDKHMLPSFYSGCHP